MAKKQSSTKKTPQSTSRKPSQPSEPSVEKAAAGIERNRRELIDRAYAEQAERERIERDASMKPHHVVSELADDVERFLANQCRNDSLGVPLLTQGADCLLNDVAQRITRAVFLRADRHDLERELLARVAELMESAHAITIRTRLREKNSEPIRVPSARPTDEELHRLKRTLDASRITRTQRELTLLEFVAPDPHAAHETAFVSMVWDFLDALRELVRHLRDVASRISESGDQDTSLIWRPGKWYDDATGEALTAQTLRRAGGDGRVQADKRGARWHFEARSVIREYPDLAVKIRNALKGEGESL